MPGKWCPHCEIGKRCRIYGQHPRECRDFACSWLLNTGAGGPDYRPDKTRIVPEHKILPRIGLSLWLFEVSNGALDLKFVRKWTLNNLRKGNCVMHLPLRAGPKLYLPQRIQDQEFNFVIEPQMQTVEVIWFPESELAFA
jgi:hypothetical protein